MVPLVGALLSLDLVDEELEFALVKLALIDLHEL